MADATYVNFDVAIEQRGERYRARVFASPFGEPSVEFDNPIPPDQLAELAAMRDVGARTRGAQATVPTATREMGSKLFTAAFQGPVWLALTRTLDDARRRGAGGARIRLHLRDAGPLAEAPWEFLYNPDPGAHGFVGLRDESPIVRYLALAEPPQAMPVSPPLRLLAVISAPQDLSYEKLDGEQEWRNIQTALEPLERSGAIEITRLQPATMGVLHEALMDRDYHIFHFVGHGFFDEQKSDGALVFETTDGRANEVPAENVGTLLQNERALRLAVINACEGGRSSRTDPYAGIAQSLVRAGVPAVVGMQFAISDDAAIEFSRQLYRTVARGRPIDLAVTAARMSVYQRGSREWGTPVLYLRSPDARIFDITAMAPRVQDDVAPTPTATAEPAVLAVPPVTRTSKLAAPVAAVAPVASAIRERARRIFALDLSFGSLVRISVAVSGFAALALFVTWSLTASTWTSFVPTAAPSPGPATPLATPPPQATTAPLPSLPAPSPAWSGLTRGPLIYETPMDEPATYIRPARLYASPDLDAANIRTRAGALDLLINRPASEVAIPLLFTTPTKFAAELFAAFQPGSRQVTMTWEVTFADKVTYLVVINRDDEVIFVQKQDASAGLPPKITSFTTLPLKDARSGRVFEVAVRVDAGQFNLIVDGVPVYQLKEPAIAPQPFSPVVHLFGSPASTTSGVVSIYAFRFYALP